MRTFTAHKLTAAMLERLSKWRRITAERDAGIDPKQHKQGALFGVSHKALLQRGLIELYDHDQLKRTRITAAGLEALEQARREGW